MRTIQQNGNLIRMQVNSMSKLEDLIKELCPNGVEYKKLITVCSDIIVPMRDRPKIFDGTIPWCRIEDKQGQYFHGSLSGLGVSDKVVKQMNLKVFPVGTVICSCSASLGAYAINTIPLITNQTFIGLVCGDKLYNKYLLYYMETQTSFLKSQASTGTIPYVSRKKFENMSIPVPPLPVQREIVRILDNFTELTTELQEKLNAELTAHKKQYEYYRDELLTFGDDVPVVKLGNIATVTKLAGFEFTKYVTYSDKGDIIALRGLNVKNGKLNLDDVKYIDKSDLSKLTRSKLVIGDMLFTYVGTVGQVALIDENDRFYLAPNVALIRITNDNVMPEFMRYYFQTNTFWNTQIKRLLQSSSMKNIPMEKIRKFELPVPPLEEQQRIVAILDRFDALCNDLTNGLPAEIEARQKQYEYYRDKLLTFKEASKC